MTDDSSRLRALPSVHSVLERLTIQNAIVSLGRSAVLTATQQYLEAARSILRAGRTFEFSEDRIYERAVEIALGSLRPVVNATGVLLHTNLGRAPLAQEALEAVVRVGRGYSSLEFDLELGHRGDRHSHPVALLRTLTGAEDALVVNNNAAALLLALSALTQGREVIVSRGELVEIGGGFRIPDVLRQSGAKLVEVGTTNKTHLNDYRHAFSAETGAILKVYPSAFTIVGFTSEVSLTELVSLKNTSVDFDVPILYDAGSGSLLDEFPQESIRARIQEGADLVFFSGDKLLGGPQAGIIVGRASWVDRLRRHPLMRALRPDKLTLAALVATLRLWCDTPEKIPLIRMFRRPLQEIEQRARQLTAALPTSLGAEVIPTQGQMGGGAWPTRNIPSFAVALAGTNAWAGELRRGSIPTIARVEEGKLLLDLRTVQPEEDVLLLKKLLQIHEQKRAT